MSFSLTIDHGEHGQWWGTAPAARMVESGGLATVCVVFLPSLPWKPCLTAMMEGCGRNSLLSNIRAEHRTGAGLFQGEQTEPVTMFERMGSSNAVNNDQCLWLSLQQLLNHLASVCLMGLFPNDRFPSSEQKFLLTALKFVMSRDNFPFKWKGIIMNNERNNEMCWLFLTSVLTYHVFSAVCDASFIHCYLSCYCSLLSMSI